MMYMCRCYSTCPLQVYIDPLYHRLLDELLGASLQSPSSSFQVKLRLFHGLPCLYRSACLCNWGWTAPKFKQPPYTRGVLYGTASCRRAGRGRGRPWLRVWGWGGYMGKHYTPVCLAWSGWDSLVIYETSWYPSPVLTLGLNHPVVNLDGVFQLNIIFVVSIRLNYRSISIV